MVTATPVFRFDAERHLYTLNDQPIPSVTQLIERGGLVKGSEYFTESSRRRGRIVHDLTANYDLGVDLGSDLETSEYRGYVLAYIAACDALNPAWEAIEEPEVHTGFRFAGRPDRAGLVFSRPTVAELKSGAKAKHHPIQTALQALLVAYRFGVEPQALQRLCVYFKSTGKYSVEQHEDRRDFDVANSLIRGFCL